MTSYTEITQPNIPVYSEISVTASPAYTEITGYFSPNALFMEGSEMLFMDGIKKKFNTNKRVDMYSEITKPV